MTDWHILCVTVLSNASFEKGYQSQAAANSRKALVVSVVGILIAAVVVITGLIVYWPSSTADPVVKCNGLC